MRSAPSVPSSHCRQSIVLPSRRKCLKPSGPGVRLEIDASRLAGQKRGRTFVPVVVYEHARKRPVNAVWLSPYTSYDRSTAVGPGESLRVLGLRKPSARYIFYRVYVSRHAVRSSTRIPRARVPRPCYVRFCSLLRLEIIHFAAVRFMCSFVSRKPCRSVRQSRTSVARFSRNNEISSSIRQRIWFAFAVGLFYRISCEKLRSTSDLKRVPFARGFVGERPRR